MPDRTRTGARSYSEVSPSLRRQIESGEIETATHVEQMAIDMGVLLKNSFPHLEAESTRFSGQSFLDRMRTGGEILWSNYGTRVSQFVSEPSDLVRGWAAMAVGTADGLTLEQSLPIVKAYAVDGHFGVREWAWLSVRHVVVNHLDSALSALLSWVRSDHPYERRFAVEVTRPRSVWGKHIATLKERPQIALPLLEPLKCEAHPYVSNSIGNWLNDASKDRPAWVGRIAQEWLESCNCSFTTRIVRRATRSLEVAGVAHGGVVSR